MARKKRAGRPKGSKNKSTINPVEQFITGVTSKRRGRPAGIKSKRRGRPAGSGRKNNLHSLLTPGSIQGLHFIGRTLIIDTETMNVDEVIFLGEGTQPKVR
jgi:hypothetical protein